MAERNGHHAVGLRSRVWRTDSIRAGILSASVHSSDTRIRHHDSTRRSAAGPKGAVITTAPFFAFWAMPRGDDRGTVGGH